MLFPPPLEQKNTLNINIFKEFTPAVLHLQAPLFTTPPTHYTHTGTHCWCTTVLCRLHQSHEICRVALSHYHSVAVEVVWLWVSRPKPKRRVTQLWHSSSIAHSKDITLIVLSVSWSDKKPFFLFNYCVYNKVTDKEERVLRHWARISTNHIWLYMQLCREILLHCLERLLLFKSMLLK